MTLLLLQIIQNEINHPNATLRPPLARENIEAARHEQSERRHVPKGTQMKENQQYLGVENDFPAVWAQSRVEFRYVYGNVAACTVANNAFQATEWHPDDKDGNHRAR